MSLDKKHIIDAYSWRTKQLEVLGSIASLIDLILKGNSTGCFELTVERHIPEEFKLEDYPYKSVEMLPSTLAMVVPSCMHENCVEEGDCPAGNWWWVCQDCGQRSSKIVLGTFKEEDNERA